VEAVRLEDASKQREGEKAAAARAAAADSSLLKLVEPELGVLWRLWLAVLRDHALLSIPAGKPW